MNLDQIRSTLEADGAEVELLESGGSRALVLRRLPQHARLESASDEDTLWIVEGDAKPLLHGGAAVAGNGELILGADRIPVLRIAVQGLRPVETKIPEGPGNLKARAGWFGKRSGPQS
jgi:hypothetical protein